MTEPQKTESRTCPYLKKIYDLLKNKFTAVPYEYEAATVSTTIYKLNTLKLQTLTNRILITVEDNSIRIRTDGLSPTASEGHLFNAGDSIILEDKTEMRNFQAIRKDAADAKLKITYYAPLKENES